MKKSLKTNSLFIFIILIAALFRVYGLNWDQGFHLHPDERAIVMFTTPLQFPKTIAEFFSVQSTWNPHFFAYGSFPIYFLKTAGNIASIVDTTYATYDKINLLGRFISAIFDIGTLVVLFFLAKKIFNKNVALITSFFYAISVLPIQLSHFYAVDTLLTFFVLLTLYRLIIFYEKSSFRNAFLVGIFFGLSLATKTSALVLIASIGIAIAVDFLLVFIKNPHRPHIWFPHISKFLKRLFIDITIIMIITVITFIIFEPYALIDFSTFWQQQLQQRQMTYDAFTFPYTLQYVGKIPYWYELKNIFLFGLGPIVATFSFLGVLYITFRLAKHLGWWRKHQTFDSFEVDKKWKQELIILSFFWIYFLVVGNFAIGFMRYMLPLYPLLCLFAAVLLYRLLSSRPPAGGFGILFIILLAWPLSFIYIYSQPNTRVQATNWINQNIPSGKTIALEHWDDGLPLSGQQNYKVVYLPLYDPDTTQKWETINQNLQQTDYIIIASNRLYTPLQKMTNCQKLPVGRCYTQTAEYYKNLFNGSLGFQKAAEFSVLPTFTLYPLRFTLDDSSSDESFTVYDHPKVIIFKRKQT